MNELGSATDYESRVSREVRHWREQMLRQPGMFGWMAGRVQSKVNSYIPAKAHAAITTLIREMTQTVLTGSELVSSPPLATGSLATRDKLAEQKIQNYRTTATVEGGIAGIGGILLGLAEFPVLFSIKLKLLFDLAAVYGHSCSQFSERLYVLQIFQLAFSSQQHRRKIFLEIDDWHNKDRSLPTSFDGFDWRTYQQEYRNYIDLAKLAQLIPIVGAPVGAMVNYRLLQQLGDTAMNAYRLRWFAVSNRLGGLLA